MARADSLRVGRLIRTWHALLNLGNELVKQATSEVTKPELLFIHRSGEKRGVVSVLR